MVTCNFFFFTDWEKKWVQSEHKGKEFGPFKLTAGKFYGDADKDKGIQTGQVLNYSYSDSKMIGLKLSLHQSVLLMRLRSLKLRVLYISFFFFFSVHLNIYYKKLLVRFFMNGVFKDNGV